MLFNARKVNRAHPCASCGSSCGLHVGPLDPCPQTRAHAHSATGRRNVVAYDSRASTIPAAPATDGASWGHCRPAVICAPPRLTKQEATSEPGNGLPGPLVRHLLNNPAAILILVVVVNATERNATQQLFCFLQDNQSRLLSTRQKLEPCRTANSPGTCKPSSRHGYEASSTPRSAEKHLCGPGIDRGSNTARNGLILTSSSSTQNKPVGRRKKPQNRTTNSRNRSRM